MQAEHPREEHQGCVDVATHDDAWLCVMTEEAWEALFKRCCEVTLSKGGSVSVCLTDDTEITLLNTQYRGKSSPTNVLAFPQDMPDLLGDVVLAYGVIAAEATDQNKQFVDHVTHLFIHGLLHLLGYDHMNEQEEKAMESLETKILAALGVANPYE